MGQQLRLSHLATDLGLVQGSDVELMIEGGRLVLTSVKSRRARLQELLDGMTEENRHELVDFGPPVGEEVW